MGMGPTTSWRIRPSAVVWDSTELPPTDEHDGDRGDSWPELVAEARTMPGGRVYEIVGDYGPNDAVPPTAIRGGWKVDDASRIVGDFLPNPKFRQPG